VKRSLPAFVLGTSVFALDQATKWLALERLRWGHPVEVIPGFFNLTLVGNTGAAWGILHDQKFWLTLLALAALIFLTLARRHFTHIGVVPRIALGLLLGGIAGNLLDRVARGHVIDFLSFFIWGYPWPAFNIADSAICVGVGLYMVDSLFRKESAVVNAS